MFYGTLRGYLRPLGTIINICSSPPLDRVTQRWPCHRSQARLVITIKQLILTTHKYIHVNKVMLRGVLYPEVHVNRNPKKKKVLCRRHTRNGTASVGAPVVTCSFFFFYLLLFFFSPPIMPRVRVRQHFPTAFRPGRRHASLSRRATTRVVSGQAFTLLPSISRSLTSRAHSCATEYSCGW